ncbi:MAG: BlaI/MecI/CopY family transcriptional regulator [Acidobacteriia bacterium]|nr:BlaI/MecI/CopY family transcriptional regulator [Terriglobia bacterium]
MRLSEAEWQIMKALWRCQPATVRDLIEHLPPGVDWAYTTVKTMLTRLETKRAVSERKNKNVSVYEALVSPETARGSAWSTFLNQAFDGAMEPLLHFLVRGRKLTKKQRRQLAQLLEEEERREKEEK